MHGFEARGRERGHPLGGGTAWDESEWGKEGGVHPGMLGVAWYGRLKLGQSG